MIGSRDFPAPVDFIDNSHLISLSLKKPILQTFTNLQIYLQLVTLLKSNLLFVNYRPEFKVCTGENYPSYAKIIRLSLFSESAQLVSALTSSLFMRNIFFNFSVVALTGPWDNLQIL